MGEFFFYTRWASMNAYIYSAKFYLTLIKVTLIILQNKC